MLPVDNSSLLTTTMERNKCLPANPDISGIGVRAAIYAQNLLCFLPVGVYLWDKKISPDELAGVKDQSVGMLAIAFSILITTIILGEGPGSEGPTISSYHAAIVLDLSWMNNTSTWIWFILFAHHRSTVEYKPTDATWSAWRDLLWSPIAGFLHGEGGTGNREQMEGNGRGKHRSIQRSFLHLWGFVRRLFHLVTAAPVLTLGSIHLSLMAAIGIWLWLNPAKFGKPIVCDPDPTLALFGASINFSSTPLRFFSLAMYSLLLIPGFNLLPPFLFFLTLHVWYNGSRNRHEWFWNPCVRAFERISGALWRNKARKPSAEEAAGSPVASASNQDPPGTSSRTPVNSNNPTHSYPPSPSVTFSRVADSPAVHTAFLTVGLVCLVAINVLFIVDIELTLHRNKENQTDEERQWGFGQILALLLLVVPLRDAWNALRDIRNHFQQQFEQIFLTVAEAKPLTETVDDLSELVISGANPWKPISGRFVNLLQVAAYYGKQDLVDFLLSVDENKRVPEDAAGGDYGTALQAACARGHDEVVKLLLDKKADVNVKGGDYGNALCAAVANGRANIVQDLVERVQDLKATGPFGTALHVAVIMEYEEMVKLLLGKDPKRADCEWGNIGNAVDVAVVIRNRKLYDLLQGKGLTGRCFERAEEREERVSAAASVWHDKYSLPLLNQQEERRRREFEEIFEEREERFFRRFRFFFRFAFREEEERIRREFRRARRTAFFEFEERVSAMCTKLQKLVKRDKRALPSNAAH